jgi:hypothetical protein
MERAKSDHAIRDRWNYLRASVAHDFETAMTSEERVGCGRARTGTAGAWVHAATLQPCDPETLRLTGCLFQ